ncbi:S-adenosyl-L-methionine-dependent methyltransferase [Gonapodya prolifera JEL478]|uniref:S-adenosyl-L-methionine-dependent methyltransferase n=1 Tax=Gonapodya prolifera (strain JEL478) TaxID=1344416 RepID=A0A139AT77_GONPJ|nr:S-adenosyl-L-methionine-dependent methyltransferase [Gonapodya prolifera JEL478]|eukprot:KXS19940.1 S-adenosyl-L-methionine-dependent methyltransferase [Gonapodya prolifera JEL478]
MPDVLPSDNAHYKTQQYWDSRYQTEGPDATFDWFKSYDDIRPVLEANLPPPAPSSPPPHPGALPHLLVLGCGNSTLSESLALVSGYTHVTSVDYSAVVVEAMRARTAKLGLDADRFTFQVADIRDMALFAAESFAGAIDKGTMDALLTGDGEDGAGGKAYDPWNPPRELCAEVERYVREVHRVLCSRGVFIYITFGQPHFRRRHLELTTTDGVPLWESIKVQTVGDAFHYYVYVCTKT